MTSSNQSNQFKITYHPSNSNGPHQITCLNSDATQNTWPLIGPCPTSIKSSTSWDSIDLNSRISIKWLSILGKGLADSLGLIKCNQKEDWKLTNFPENYQLFNYIKGSLQDQYLFGSSHVRKFRTANEFLPHLQWLATSNSTITCQCKYCAGTKSQTDTNSNFTNHSQQPSQRSNKPTNSKRKSNKRANLNQELTSPEDSSEEIIRKRPSKKFKIHEFGNRSSSEVPAIPGSNGTHSEINAIDSQQKFNYLGPYLSKDLKTDLKSDRSNFREYELIWCNIEDQFIGNQDCNLKNKDRFDLGTNYWPGLCEEMVLETQACITIDDDDDDDDDEENKKSTNRRSNETLINSKNQQQLVVKRAKNKRLRLDSSKGISTSSFTKIKSEQTFSWKIRLLGLEEIIIRDESLILPWLFQPISNINEKFNLKNLINLKTLSNYLIERQKEIKRPMLNNFTCIEDAKVNFLLALQIGANLEESWSISDPYDLHPDEEEEESEEIIRRPIINHKFEINETNQQESRSKEIPEKWYQSVWWGAEKIWMFDTVRLNKIETDLPLELFKDHQDSKFNHIDSNDKAYFLKIDGIYRDSIEETIIMIGKVYDLVSISSSSNTTTTTKNNKPLTNHQPKPKPSIVVVIDDDEDEEKESRSTPKINKLTNEPMILDIPKDPSDLSFEYLPIPPKGYQFRQLTPFGEAHHVHLNCIAGRYYSPAIKNKSNQLSNLSKRFLSKIISSSSTTSISISGNYHLDLTKNRIENNGNLNNIGKPKDLQRKNSSLFGLTAGRWNFMKCTKWKVNRMKSIMESERLAEEEMTIASSRLNGTFKIS